MANSKWQKRKGYHYKKREQVVAVVIDNVGGTVVGRRYYTQDIPNVLKKFLRDMSALFPAATHVNLYDQQKNFIRREQLQANLFTQPQKILTNRKYFALDPVTKCIFENSLY